MPLLDFFLNDLGGQTVKNLRFDVGATLPSLRVRLLDGQDPVNLTGATVTFTMIDKNGVEKISAAAAVLENATGGIVRYDWVAGNTNEEKVFFGQFKVVIGADNYLIPNNADQVLRIVMGNAEFQAGPAPVFPPIGLEVVSLGGTPGVDASPKWKKLTLTEADFTAAAALESLTLMQLPAGAVIHTAKIKHSAAFTGGALSAFTLELGITGSLAKYASAFDVFSAPAATNDQVTTSGDEESHDLATPILITARSTGGDVADATQGTVEIWLLVSSTTASAGSISADGIETQADGITTAGGPFRFLNFKGFDLVANEGGGIVGITALRSLRKQLISGFGTNNSTALFEITGLTIAVPAAGSYHVKWFLFINQAGAIAGIKLQPSYTGVVSISRLAVSDFGKDNKTFNEGGINSANSAVAALITIAQAAAGDYLVVIEGGFEASGAGNMRLLMGQSVSDAALTTMQTQSYAEIKEI